MVSSVALLCGQVGRRRAHSTMAQALCVVCASPLGVVVDRRRACPHRRDVGPLVHSRCQWCRDPLGHNGSARLCVEIAVFRPTLVTPDDREAQPMRARFGGIPCCICVVAVIRLCDRRVSTAWRHTPVIHYERDRRPNRNAFTLLGPSPNLRCWFGKGAPLIAAKPLSWVSPLPHLC